MIKSSSDLYKSVSYIVLALAITVILYFVNDLSLQSMLAFTTYSILGLFCLWSSFHLCKSKNLIIAFLFFEITYLSVYVLSISLSLNTSLFDFIKGVAFSFVVFSLLACVKFVFNRITNRSSSTNTSSTDSCSSYSCSSNSCLKSSNLSKHLLSILYFVLVFIGLFFPLLMICYYVATGSLISSDIILALAQTNGSEGKEFFVSNFNVMWVVSFVILVVIVAVNYILLNRVCAVSKSAESDKQSSKLQFALFSLFVMIVSVFLALPRMDYLPYAVVKVTSRQLDNFDAYKKQKGARLEKLKTLTSLKLDNNLNADGNLFVLVIGESETRDRMGVYGFNRDNTPNLSKESESLNTVLFKNAYASWPQTVQVLSYALTQANQYSSIETVDAFSIMEIAKAAGYTTYWLSNQRKFGVYETPITVVASTADKEIWTNGSAKMEGVFFDEELLNRFPKIDPKKNNFIVIHLMGSHQKYEKRLPSEYKVFKGDDENNDYYDDTVLYTDHIVSEIYKKAKSYSSFMGMVYLSDHGEDPHIVGGHDPVNVNAQMLRIPAVVYFSDNYINRCKNIYTNLKANSDNYWSNDLLYELMVSLLRIEGAPNFNLKLDIASDKYDLDKNSVMTMYGKKHVTEYEK